MKCRVREESEVVREVERVRRYEAAVCAGHLARQPSLEFLEEGEGATPRTLEFKVLDQSLYLCPPERVVLVLCGLIVQDLDLPEGLFRG